MSSGVGLGLELQRAKYYLLLTTYHLLLTVGGVEVEDHVPQQRAAAVMVVQRLLDAPAVEAEHEVDGGVCEGDGAAVVVAPLVEPRLGRQGAVLHRPRARLIRCRVRARASRACIQTLNLPRRAAEASRERLVGRGSSVIAVRIVWHVARLAVAVTARGGFDARWLRRRRCISGRQHRTLAAVAGRCG